MCAVPGPGRLRLPRHAQPPLAQRLMQRNGQKRPKQKSMGKDGRKKVFFLSTFSAKAFDMDFSQKVFCGVFELPLVRNAQKRHKKKEKKKVPTYRI
jgi:hypothetical protein